MNKELLKLEYEHFRAYTFALFTALLVIAFGVISNIKNMGTDIIILLSFSTILLLIVFFVCLNRMGKRFEELKRALK